MVYDSCPLCGSKNIKLFWKIVWGDPDKVSKKCSDCELLFISPPTTEHEQTLFDLNYNNYIKKRERFVARYINKKFENLVDDSIEERFNDISSNFLNVSSVMEIGAEKGGFLSRLQNTVDNLTGIDPCREYQEILRKQGLCVYSYIDDVPDGEEYDRICFFSLLEHIRDPVPFMLNVKKHLKPNGIIVAEVPFIKDPLLSLYDNDAFKSFTIQAMHPFIYSERALSLLFAKTSLKIIKFQYKQRYGISNHIQWLKKGHPGVDKNIEQVFKKLNKEYVSTLESSGNTDTIYLLARHAD